MRRLAFRVLFCLAAAWAVPVRAEDPAARTEPLKTDLFDDVIDGIGGVLKILVGPPISSPSPYLNTPDRDRLSEDDVPPVKVAAPPLPQPAEAPAEAPASVTVPQPVPVSLPPKEPVAPPPVVKPVVVPPVPRPTAPAVAAPAAPPPPVAASVPACSVRVAATATLEQMRRLPKCP